MTLLVGFIASAVASIFFGSNFVVIKEYDMGDGMYWQFIMAVGVWFFGLVFTMIQQGSIFTFHPLAITGGIIWSTGNLMTVPIFKTIGMALGFSIWCSVQLILGWSTGKFGILGTAKDTSVKKEWLNILGIVLVFIALGLYLLVKPNKEQIDDKKFDKEYYKNGDIENFHIPRTKAAIFGDTNENQHTVNSQQDILIKETSNSLLRYERKQEKEVVSSWVDRLNNSQKNMVGVICAIIAGVCYGLNFQPVQWMINNKSDNNSNYSGNLDDYVFAFYNGILFTALFWFLLYVIYMKNKPQINKRAVFPSIIGGILWAIAMSAYFVSMDKNNLGVEATFPIVSAGPQVVASLWGVLYYKEIQGTKNKLILWSAIVVSCVAIGCIALSKY
eukprot:298612_1